MVWPRGSLRASSPIGPPSASAQSVSSTRSVSAAPASASAGIPSEHSAEESAESSAEDSAESSAERSSASGSVSSSSAQRLRRQRICVESAALSRPVASRRDDDARTLSAPPPAGTPAGPPAGLAVPLCSEMCCGSCCGSCCESCCESCAARPSTTVKGSRSPTRSPWRAYPSSASDGQRRSQSRSVWLRRRCGACLRCASVAPSERAHSWSTAALARTHADGGSPAVQLCSKSRASA